MDFYDIIYSIAVRKKISLENVSLNFGKTANYIYTQKSRGSSPKIDTAAKLLASLGYAICAIPSDAVPEGTYTVSVPVKEEE